MTNKKEESMAVLESGLLKVEIQYIDDFEADHSLQFFYDSRPLVNPEIMGEGFLGVDRVYTLTPFLESALLSDSPSAWKPWGPAVIIEISGKLPNDHFELTFFADVVGLKVPYPRDTNYIGNYIALRITVTREELQHFVNVLKDEQAIYRQSKGDLI